MKGHSEFRRCLWLNPRIDQRVRALSRFHPMRGGLLLKFFGLPLSRCELQVIHAIVQNQAMQCGKGMRKAQVVPRPEQTADSLPRD